MGSIKSADDLETADLAEMRSKLSGLGVETLAVAMHGLSPLARSRIRKALPIWRRIVLAFSPVPRTSVPLSLVEATHREIVERFNAPTA